ncbi:acetoacetyl-CoA reductase [bacterium]|nr:acetoacetyl-CoA reductase [bacterium]
MSKSSLAIVTGGTGAIGTAICAALHADGHSVAAIGHPSEAEKIDTWRNGLAFEAHVYLADLADFEATTACLASIEAELGQAAVVVNAAGITRDAPLKKMDAQAWRAVMGANLDSVFNVTRPLITAMIENAHGRIINIASINGQKGQFGQTNYSAAKAGMHGFTMALAQEVAKHGITVNTVSPGYIDSPMIRAVPEPIRDNILSGIPAGRFGTPEDIARVVAFLAAPESGYLTGANIPVNGGQFMH